jgi:hypothetical protein
MTYFRSKVAAIRYYELFGYERPDIMDMIKTGLIRIGFPPLKAGETIRYMEGGRYRVAKAA